MGRESRFTAIWLSARAGIPATEWYLPQKAVASPEDFGDDFVTRLEQLLAEYVLLNDR